jgi:Zn-dependent protease with chaperone function
VIQPKPLTGLNPVEYEHRFDAKALDALQATPGLDRFVRAFNKNFVERAATVEWTGSYLRVTAEGYPKIHSALDRVCGVINLPSRPSLYVSWDYHVNGETLGVDDPIIKLTSAAIDYLDEPELLFLLGHEVGHIKSRHTLYHQMAGSLGALTAGIGQVTMGIGNLISWPLIAALSWWQRMSELTADRAGLLACQDIDAAIRWMMKCSGVPRKHFTSMQRESFLDQAREFEKLDYEVMNKTWKWIYSYGMTHPWTVLRAAELMRWVESGEYQAVLERKAVVDDKPPVQPPKLYCHQCGGQLTGTEAFCPACGQGLTRDQVS